MFSRYLLRAHTHRTSQPLKKVPPTLSSLTRTYAQQHKPSPNAFRLPPTLTQLVTNPSNHLNGEVEVSGWIKSIRKQKNVAFAVLTDGSSEKGLQAVLVRGEGEEDGDVLRSLTNGAAVRLRGRLVESPGKGQSHELLVERGKEGAVEVLGECDPETYPIQKKLLSNEYLRDNVHLRARTSQNAAMLRLRSGLSRRLGEWFENQGFYAVNTPILTANDAEGAGESFRIAPLPSGHPAASPSPSAPTSSTSPSPSTSPSTSPSHPNPNQQLQEFFTRPAHLTVSHQLHLEAIATGLSRVYTLSPCFRAEPSLTGRHLAEFWMLEAEWAFIQQQHQNGGGVHEVCDVVEAMLRGTVGPLVNPANLNPDVQTLWKSSAASSGKNAALHDKKLSNLQSAFGTNEWWPRMSYTEAITHLESAPRSIKAKWEFEPKWGRPLQSEHERVGG
ncbi:asparaginyl-tRNA synthetase [Coprinopsis cinerea AmutBmut pab1-1]|nr:asparaginyl-tRNA synthetase [Coprinopsis cinerea AmutBmut pab1-1]